MTSMLLLKLHINMRSDVHSSYSATANLLFCNRCHNNSYLLRTNNISSTVIEHKNWMTDQGFPQSVLGTGFPASQESTMDSEPTISQISCLSPTNIPCNLDKNIKLDYKQLARLQSSWVPKQEDKNK